MKFMNNLILIGVMVWGLTVQAAYSPACDSQVKKITQNVVKSVKPDLIFQGSDYPELSPLLHSLVKDYSKRAPEVFQRDSFYRISSFMISEVDTFQNNKRLGKIVSISNNLYRPGLMTYVIDTRNHILSITPYNGQTVWVCQQSN